jgi:hypothetical protein
MAKNKIRDWSTNPDDNTDVGGVGIQGSNLPSNLDNAQRTTMAQIADVNDGNETVDDTWGYSDPADPTKKFRFDAGTIPTGTARVIDAEKLFDLDAAFDDITETAARRGAPTVTGYTASGTHTFAANTNYYMLVAVGSGGGSGNVDGQGSGTGGSTAGANSGFFGRSPVYAKGALTDGDIVIGAGGTAGATSSGAGGDGGDVTWTDDTLGTLTWKGGKGSNGLVATGQHAYEMPLANGASSAVLVGFYGIGHPGATNGVSDSGGLGGSTPWGTGGISTRAVNAAVDGVAGSGYGAGASGSASSSVGTNATGAAGTSGRLEVWEW